jgi:hypothetical protein
MEYFLEFVGDGDDCFRELLIIYGVIKKDSSEIKFGEERDGVYL